MWNPKERDSFKEKGQQAAEFAATFLPRKKVAKEIFPESKPAFPIGSVHWFMRFQHSTKEQ